jgi:hypothetical protein
LAIGDCGLRLRIEIADCGLRIADCGLRIADCGLRIADCWIAGFADGLGRIAQSTIGKQSPIAITNRNQQSQSTMAINNPQS